MITGARRIKDLIRNRAKGDSAKAQMLLRHFAMERLLERLSVSPYKSDFILKGGMLLSSIVGIEERMTRDIDATMRSRDMSPENVARIINEISSIDIGDGFTFELGEATEIMEDSEYGGVRIPVTASIERTKTTFKIDVSTGDAITPDAIEYVYRLMFEDRSISLHSYNDETFLGERLETILSLATQNTRMRDFYDIWALRTSGHSEHLGAKSIMLSSIARLKQPEPYAKAQQRSASSNKYLPFCKKVRRWPTHGDATSCRTHSQNPLIGKTLWRHLTPQ